MIFLGTVTIPVGKRRGSIINEPYPLNKPDYVVRSSAIQASDSRLLLFRLRI